MEDFKKKIAGIQLPQGVTLSYLGMEKMRGEGFSDDSGQWESAFCSSILLWSLYMIPMSIRSLCYSRCRLPWSALWWRLQLQENH